MTLESVLESEWASALELALVSASALELALASVLAS
jgi:hypothetical protein